MNLAGGPLRRLQAAAARAVRQGVFYLAAALTFGVAVAFLTMAAWFALAAARGPGFASLIVGAVYLALACILVGIAVMAGRTRSDQSVSRRSAMNRPPRAPVINAFMAGFNSGRRARRPRSRT